MPPVLPGGVRFFLPGYWLFLKRHVRQVGTQAVWFPSILQFFFPKARIPVIPFPSVTVTV